MLWHVIACERAWCQSILYTVYCIFSFISQGEKFKIVYLHFASLETCETTQQPLVHCTGLSHLQYTKFKLTHNSLDSAPLNVVTFNEGIKKKVCLVTYFVW